MRIAVTTSTARVVGGAETYLETVIPALQASGHQIALLSEHQGPEGRRQIMNSAGIPAWCAATLGLVAASRKLAEWNPEIIFGQAALSTELDTRIAELAPLVSMVHDYRGSCISGSKSYRWPSVKACSRALGPGCLAYFYPRRCGGLHPLTMLRDYSSQLRRLAHLRTSAMVLTASKHMRNEYCKYDLDPDRIRCVGYPVRTPLKGAPATAPPGGDGVLPSRVLFAARLEYMKGATILLDAMPRVVTALGRKLKLILAGDGRERTVLEAQAARIAENEPKLTIEFRGWLDAELMQAEYRLADLLVMPSLWPEPFGLAGPEAGLNGVPAAAFAMGGIPEWLSHGRNGLLAPANPPTTAGLTAAIVECLRDPERHSRMRVAAIELASRFSAERHIRQLNEIFAEVAGRRAMLAASN
jgi:glycosyltransferase involved in cell wall biosynthesis